MSNKELLPTMLAYFGVADSGTQHEVARVFGTRNSTLHGLRDQPASEKEAHQAVRIARLLIRARSRETGTQ